MAIGVATVRPAHATRRAGAVVVREGNVCAISGEAVGYNGDILTDVQDIQTPNGKSNFRCAGQIPAGFEPERAIAIKGTCFGPVGNGVGTIVFSPAGAIGFECQIH